MTFGTIVDRVAQYLDRSDLGTSGSSPLSSTKIAGWVNDTRNDIALKHNFRYLYAEATASTEAGTAKYALPSDYLGHLVVWCGAKKLMRVSAREYDELTQTKIAADASPRELTLEPGTSVSTESIAGAPDYYIDRGMEIELYPTPDAVYTLRLRYYAQPASFVVANDSDYISNFHYEAIIWGACLRGAIYLDDNDGIRKYADLYNAAIKEMIKREKDFDQEDQHMRMKTYTDYDLTTFKRLFKIKL